MTVDYNKFQGMPSRTHNIFLDWDKNATQDASKMQNRSNLIKDLNKKSIMKKVNFKGSNISNNIDKIQNKSSFDKIKDLINNDTQRSQRSQRSGELTSTNYGHFLVKMLEKSKYDNILREKLKSLLKAYEIIGDFLKFNNETLTNMLKQSDRDGDGDLDK